MWHRCGLLSCTPPFLCHVSSHPFPPLPVLELSSPHTLINVYATQWSGQLLSGRARVAIIGISTTGQDQRRAIWDKVLSGPPQLSATPVLHRRPSAQPSPGWHICKILHFRAEPGTEMETLCKCTSTACFPGVCTKGPQLCAGQGNCSHCSSAARKVARSQVLDRS